MTQPKIFEMNTSDEGDKLSSCESDAEDEDTVPLRFKQSVLKNKR